MIQLGLNLLQQLGIYEVCVSDIDGDRHLPGGGVLAANLGEPME
jgi:hypothetical protein